MSEQGFRNNSGGGNSSAGQIQAQGDSSQEMEEAGMNPTDGFPSVKEKQNLAALELPPVRPAIRITRARPREIDNQVVSNEKMVHLEIPKSAQMNDKYGKRKVQNVGEDTQKKRSRNAVPAKDAIHPGHKNTLKAQAPRNSTISPSNTSLSQSDYSNYSIPANSGSNSCPTGSGVGTSLDFRQVSGLKKLMEHIAQDKNRELAKILSKDNAGLMIFKEVLKTSDFPRLKRILGSVNDGEQFKLAESLLSNKVDAISRNLAFLFPLQSGPGNDRKKGLITALFELLVEAAEDLPSKGCMSGRKATSVTLSSSSWQKSVICNLALNIVKKDSDALKFLQDELANGKA